MRLIIRRTYLVIPLILAIVFLLFLSQGELFWTRSWKALWNLGHIPLFILIGYVVFLVWPGLHLLKLFYQWLILLFLAVVIGGLIEFIQALVGRDANLVDVILDILGISIAPILFSPSYHALIAWQRRTGYCLIGLILALACKPLGMAIIDEYHAYRQFPTLSGFEYPAELTRWRGYSYKSISQEVASNGRSSMRVQLGIRHNSGVIMTYFPGDWSGYRYLSFKVMNRNRKPFSLSVSIFDHHGRANGFRFIDGYIKAVEIRPGWNEVLIPLAAVQQGLKHRQMDLSQIAALRLLVARPYNGQEFFLDSVRLEQ